LFTLKAKHNFWSFFCSTALAVIDVERIPYDGCSGFDSSQRKHKCAGGRRSR
jgi:hypothetical protein